MRISRFTVSHLAEAIPLITDCFTTGPYSWGKAVNRPPHLFEQWMTHVYLPEAVSQGFSLAAVDSSTHHLTGLLVLEPFKAEHESRGEYDRGMRAIESLLISLDRIFLEGLARRNAPPSPHAYVAFIAVDKAHRGQHIAQQLIRAGLDECRARQYKLAVAHCVSPMAATCFARQGFQEWGAIAYSSFTVENDTPFASIPDSAYVMVAEL